MKTSPLDALLVSFCLILLIGLATSAAWLVPVQGSYAAILAVGVFLLAYGLFSMLFLKIVRFCMPYPIGTFDMNSKQFTYWKINAVLVDLATKALTPFNTVFTQQAIHAGFGAKVDGNSAMAGEVRDHPLISVGMLSTLGQNCVVTGHVIAEGRIIMGPVKVGEGAVVGIGAIVLPNCEIGDYSVLAPNAVANLGTVIPPHQLWGGIPARYIKDLKRPDEYAH